MLARTPSVMRTIMFQSDNASRSPTGFGLSGFALTVEESKWTNVCWTGALNRLKDTGRSSQPSRLRYKASVDGLTIFNECPFSIGLVFAISCDAERAY